MAALDATNDSDDVETKVARGRCGEHIIDKGRRDGVYVAVVYEGVSWCVRSNGDECDADRAMFGMLPCGYMALG